MPIKNYAMGVCLLLRGTVSAHNKTYTVHTGDTIGTLAKKFNVPVAELISGNSLNKKHLKTGMVLKIPAPHKNYVEYRIKSGDNDWVLAHHMGTTIAQLRSMNPGTDWHHLQLGHTLKVPATASVSAPKFKSRYAVVTGDHAIIRRSPGVTAEKVTLVDSGTKVTVLNYDSGWYQLKFPKGTVGWMRGDLLKQTTPPVKVAILHHAAPKRVVVASKQAVKHAKPAVVAKHVVPHTASAAHAVLAATVEAVKPVKVASTTPESTAGPTAEKLLDKAYHLRGTRYVYGGLSSRGLDCSGFTTMVFRSVGIQLPRTSRSQAGVGVHVTKGELLPGDLLLFGRQRGSRVSHVGMYVGNGKFIHASSGHGMVRVDNLNGHYGMRLVTARRLPAIKHTGGESQTASSTQDPAPAATAVAPRPKVKADAVELPPPAAMPSKRAIKEQDNSGH